MIDVSNILFSKLFSPIKGTINEYRGRCADETALTIFSNSGR